MGNEWTPKEQEKLLIDKNENIVVSHKQKFGNLHLMVSDKYIYIQNAYEGTIQENIIELQAVESVNYNITEIRKPPSSTIPIGLLAIAIGIAMLANAIDIMISIGIALIVVGTVLLIVGAILSRTKHLEQLIIGTAGESVKIALYDLSDEELEKLQKAIFKAKNSIPNI